MKIDTSYALEYKYTFGDPSFYPFFCSSKKSVWQRRQLTALCKVDLNKKKIYIVC